MNNSINSTVKQTLLSVGVFLWSTEKIFSANATNYSGKEQNLGLPAFPIDLYVIPVLILGIALAFFIIQKKNRNAIIVHT